MSDQSLSGEDGKFFATDGRKFVYQNPMVLRGHGKSSTDEKNEKDLNTAPTNTGRKVPSWSYKPPKTGERTVTEVVHEKARRQQEYKEHSEHKEYKKHNEHQEYKQQKQQNTKETKVSALGYITNPVKYIGSIFTRSKSDKKLSEQPSPRLSKSNDTGIMTPRGDTMDIPNKQESIIDDSDTVILAPTVIQSMGDFDAPKRKHRPVANTKKNDNWKMVNMRNPKPITPSSQLTNSISALQRETELSTEVINSADNGIFVTKKDKTNTTSFRIQTAEGIAAKAKAKAAKEKEKLKASKNNNRRNKHPTNAFTPHYDDTKATTGWKRPDNLPKPIPLKMTKENLRPQVRPIANVSESHENNAPQSNQICTKPTEQPLKIEEQAPLEKNVHTSAGDAQLDILDITMLMNTEKSNDSMQEKVKKDNRKRRRTSPNRKQSDIAESNSTMIPKTTDKIQKLHTSESEITVRSRTDQKPQKVDIAETQVISTPRKKRKKKKVDIPENDSTFKPTTVQKTQPAAIDESRSKTSQKIQQQVTISESDVTVMSEISQKTQPVAASSASSVNTCTLEDDFHKINNKYQQKSSDNESSVTYSSYKDNTSIQGDTKKPIAESYGLIDNLFMLFSPMANNVPNGQTKKTTQVKKDEVPSIKTPKVSINSLMTKPDNEVQTASVNTYIKKNIKKKVGAEKKSGINKISKVSEPQNKTAKKIKHKIATPLMKKESNSIDAPVKMKSPQNETVKTQTNTNKNSENKSPKKEQLNPLYSNTDDTIVSQETPKITEMFKFGTPIIHKNKTPIEEHIKTSLNTDMDSEIKNKKVPNVNTLLNTTDNQKNKTPSQEHMKTPLNKKMDSEIKSPKLKKNDTPLNTNVNHTVKTPMHEDLKTPFNSKMDNEIILPKIKKLNSPLNTTTVNDKIKSPKKQHLDPLYSKRDVEINTPLNTTFDHKMKPSMPEHINTESKLKSSKSQKMSIPLDTAMNKKILSPIPEGLKTPLITNNNKNKSPKQQNNDPLDIFVIKPPIQEHSKSSLLTKMDCEIESQKCQQISSPLDTKISHKTETESQIHEEMQALLNTQPTFEIKSPKVENCKTPLVGENEIELSTDDKNTKHEMSTRFSSFKSNDEIKKQEKEINSDIYKDFAPCIDAMTANIDCLVESNKELMGSAEDFIMSDIEEPQDNFQEYCNPGLQVDDNIVRIPLFGKYQYKELKRDTKTKANMLASKPSEHILANKWAASHKPSLLEGAYSNRPMTRRQALAFGSSVAAPHAVDTHGSFKANRPAPSIIGSVPRRFYFSNCSNNISYPSQLNELPIDSSPVRTINQCVLGGDSRSALTPHSVVTLNISSANPIHIAYPPCNMSTNVIPFGTHMDSNVSGFETNSMLTSPQYPQIKNKTEIPSIQNLNTIDDLVVERKKSILKRQNKSDQKVHDRRSTRTRNSNTTKSRTTVKIKEKPPPRIKAPKIDSKCKTDNTTRTPYLGSSMFETLKNFCFAEKTSERGEAP